MSSLDRTFAVCCLVGIDIAFMLWNYDVHDRLNYLEHQVIETMLWTGEDTIRIRDLENRIHE